MHQLVKHNQIILRWRDQVINKKDTSKTNM